MAELADAQKIMIPYQGGKVYGPYSRKADNRQHVIILFPGGLRLTVSYPKYIVEINEERYLDKDEEVHHKDGDETNNDYDNLEVLQKDTHKHLDRNTPQYLEMICAYCGNPFIMDKLSIYRRRAAVKSGKVKSGPFCSRECNGKANN